MAGVFFITCCRCTAEDALIGSLNSSSAQNTSKLWFSSSSVRRMCSLNTVSRELAGLA